MNITTLLIRAYATLVIVICGIGYAQGTESSPTAPDTPELPGLAEISVAYGLHQADWFESAPAPRELLSRGIATIASRIALTSKDIEEEVQGFKAKVSASPGATAMQKALSAFFDLQFEDAVKHLGAQPAQTPQEQRMLGLSLLAQERYHEAAVAFAKAIDLTTERDSAESKAALSILHGHALYGITGRNCGKDVVKNCASAAKVFREAAGIVTRETDPPLWGLAQHRLAIALYNQARGTITMERLELLKDASKTCEAALTVRTEKSDPHLWAATLRAHSAILCSLSRSTTGKEHTRYAQRSMDAISTGVKVYRTDMAAIEWALSMYHLADARQVHAGRLLGADGASLAASAAANYTPMTQTRFRRRLPQVWASAKNYLNLLRLDEAMLKEPEEQLPSLERLRSDLASLLEVATWENNPRLWAYACSNLAMMIHTIHQVRSAAGSPDPQLDAEAERLCRQVIERTNCDEFRLERANALGDLSSILLAPTRSGTAPDNAAHTTKDCLTNG
jgi:tetratricopeptide (TPR) repeat protein